MRRRLYDTVHEDFRATVARFCTEHVVPHLERWDDEGLIDRDVWLAAGRQGIIGLLGPAEYGGAGADYRFRAVVADELARVHATPLANAFALQEDTVIPYLASLGSADQRSRWLPGMCSGEILGAIAMTEPGAGSDLRAIETRARRIDGGWSLTGSKVFITSGIQADVVITVARTDDDALSLFLVEKGMEGFAPGRKLRKIGLNAQDTAELFYDDVRVPESSLLGVLDGGLAQLGQHLPVERLSIAVNAVAVAEAILADTIAYTKERQAFGRRIADFQNSQFRLAEMSTEVEVTRAFIDQCIEDLADSRLGGVDAARAKYWATDVQNRVVDGCLQLHGGYGYMAEYPVARAYRDARVQRIYGGTNEIMKHIIAKDLLAE